MSRNIAPSFTSVHSHNLNITTAVFQHMEKQEENSTLSVLHNFVLVSLVFSLLTVWCSGDDFSLVQSLSRLSVVFLCFCVINFKADEETK